MPFDGIDPMVPKRTPRRGAGDDTVLQVLILLLVVAMLVMPVSLAGLVDIVRYLRGR